MTIPHKRKLIDHVTPYSIQNTKTMPNYKFTIREALQNILWKRLY